MLELGLMPRVFVCYRREDSGGYAGRIYDRLVTRFGERRVFMDVDTIAPGEDFIEAIDATIKSCDAMIVVIGRNWLTTTDEKGRPRIQDPNDFVRLELEAALARKVKIVPTLVAGGKMPLADALPPSLQDLVRRQAIEMREPGFHDSVERLIRAVPKGSRLKGRKVFEAFFAGWERLVARFRIRLLRCVGTFASMRAVSRRYAVCVAVVLALMAAGWHWREGAVQYGTIVWARITSRFSTRPDRESSVAGFPNSEPATLDAQESASTNHSQSRSSRPSGADLPKKAFIRAPSREQEQPVQKSISTGVARRDVTPPPNRAASDAKKRSGVELPKTYPKADDRVLAPESTSAAPRNHEAAEGSPSRGIQSPTSSQTGSAPVSAPKAAYSPKYYFLILRSPSASECEKVKSQLSAVQITAAIEDIAPVVSDPAPQSPRDSTLPTKPDVCRVTVGYFRSAQAAAEMKEKLVVAGFPDSELHDARGGLFGRIRDIFR